MESPVDLIKSKLSIKDVVSSYVKLEKAGLNYRARCPFHNERTPSFFVSPGRETFHCFGCGKGGDIFTFVEEIEGVEFREALKLLADKSGVVLSREHAKTSSSQGKLRTVMEESLLFYQNEFRKSDIAKKYMSERGLDQSSIDVFKLGFAPGGWRNLATHLKKIGLNEEDAEQAGLLVKSPKGYYDRFRGRIMFPFFDYSSRPIGFSSRLIPGVTDDNQGKYVNSPETPLFHKSRVFYGLDIAKNSIREKDKVILVEGQIDVIMAHQVGTTNVIGVSGTALTLEHIETISRLTDNLTILLDADEAGFRASERSVRLALSRGLHVSVVELPVGTDPASCIQDKPEIWQNVLVKEKQFVEYALDVISTRFSDSKDMQTALKTYLYPHLADIYNEIEKDQALQKISSMLAVSHDAAQKDFEKWLITQKNNLQKEPIVEELSLPNNVLLVGRRILAISALLESRGQKEEATKLIADLREIIKMEISPSEREDLIFEAEVYYPPDKDLSVEIESLLTRLRREVNKQEFMNAMNELRKAERTGDEQEVSKWLKMCQEISKKIS
ncbi:MAG TPA: DNA primase [Candidatus Paceibacterota bacterium]